MNLTPPWNSLELAKLTVDILVPLVLLLFGIWIKRLTDRIDRRAKLSEIEVEWRLSVFRDLAPKLNLLYCYFMYVGTWRDLTPEEAISAKRECDRAIYSNRFLWTDGFLTSYRDFISTAFIESRGKGQKLQLRSNRERYQENANWRSEWDNHFVEPKDRVTREQFGVAYDSVLALAVRDLKILGA
jgi:hypothetical protein